MDFSCDRHALENFENSQGCGPLGLTMQVEARNYKVDYWFKCTFFVKGNNGIYTRIILCKIIVFLISQVFEYPERIKHFCLKFCMVGLVL